MKKYMILFIWFLCLFCKTYNVPPTKYRVKDFQERLKYLENWIQYKMDKYKVVGLSLIVVNDKEILWKFQAGYQDLEKRIKVSENTNFQIGSVSKVINAIAILKLVEKNLINLDDPIHKYVQDLPLDYDINYPITIRQLLTHHSGLPSDIMKYLWGRKYLELSEITKSLSNVYLSHHPGKFFHIQI